MAFRYLNTASATIANTTTETTLIPTGNGSLVIPANQMAPGTFVRITIRGEFITDAIAPTLQFKVKLIAGSTVIIGNTGANTTPIAGAARVFEVSLLFVTSTIGVTGTVYSKGYAIIGLTATTNALWNMTTTATPMVVDSTVDNTIDVTVQWGTANANNSLVVFAAVIETSGT